MQIFETLLRNIIYSSILEPSKYNDFVIFQKIQQKNRINLSDKCKVLGAYFASFKFMKNMDWKKWRCYIEIFIRPEILY